MWRRAGASAKGPKRPLPLAPFCKFPGMAGAVQPWEGPPLLLDGSHGYRCTASQVYPKCSAPAWAQPYAAFVTICLGLWCCLTVDATGKYSNVFEYGALLHRGGVASTSLLDASMAEDPAVAALHPRGQAPCAAATSASHAAAAAGSQGGHAQQAAGEEAAKSGDGDLAAQNEVLRRQLQHALEAGEKWRTLHSQLHSFCREQLLPSPG